MLGIGLFGLGFGCMGGATGGATAPVLLNTNGVISVVTAGRPAPPILTNTNGTITAEAA